MEPSDSHTPQSNVSKSESVQVGGKRKRPCIRDKYDWDDTASKIGEGECRFYLGLLWTDLGRDCIKGTYGVVYRGMERSSEAQVAIKKFKDPKKGEGISLTAYREIMVRLWLNRIVWD